MKRFLHLQSCCWRLACLLSRRDWELSVERYSIRLMHVCRAACKFAEPSANLQSRVFYAPAGFHKHFVFSMKYRPQGRGQDGAQCLADESPRRSL